MVLVSRRLQLQRTQTSCWMWTGWRTICRQSGIRPQEEERTRPKRHRRICPWLVSAVARYSSALGARAFLRSHPNSSMLSRSARRGFRQYYAPSKGYTVPSSSTLPTGATEAADRPFQTLVGWQVWAHPPPQLFPHRRAEPGPIWVFLQLLSKSAVVKRACGRLWKSMRNREDGSASKDHVPFERCVG